MTITERQEQILNTLILKYIKRAQPVSSQLLGKEYDFEICPATIRTEMQKLTDLGYLQQPHTSAGRMPTDKGYRFFVDKFFERDMATNRGVRVRRARAKRSHVALSRWIEKITKFLAEESSELALGYSADEKIIWKDGWQDIFEEPEFLEPGLAANFAKMINDFEENIDEMFLPEIKIYIGKENPVSKNDDFSIITAGFEGGLFALLGVKRMSYNKNIELLSKLWQKI